MIVYHVAVTTADDYINRRAPHRNAHIERLTNLRGSGVLVAGGPAPDGKSVDLFYRLDQPSELKSVIEDDPYWKGGAWTTYASRTFKGFVEPWEVPPPVLDGSRRATIIEGPTADEDMAEFAMIEMRGAGRVAFGGFFGDGTTLALATTPESDIALGWFRESGFWVAERLSGRPFLWVL